MRADREDSLLNYVQRVFASGSGPQRPPEELTDLFGGLAGTTVPPNPLDRSEYRAFSELEGSDLGRHALELKYDFKAALRTVDNLSNQLVAEGLRRHKEVGPAIDRVLVTPGFQVEGLSCPTVIVFSDEELVSDGFFAEPGAFGLWPGSDAMAEVVFSSKPRNPTTRSDAGEPSIEYSSRRQQRGHVTIVPNINTKYRFRSLAPND